MLTNQTAPTMGKVFSFNGNEVTMRLQDGTVYVNLTEFAKPFPGKNLTQIVNSLEIKEYCDALSKLQNYSLADLLQVTRGGNSNGTWAHQKVALRVAQKLSPDFAVWVDTKIEELLTTGVTTASDDDAAIAHAMDILQKRLEQAKAEKQLLEAKTQEQERIITEQAPQVEYFQRVLSSESTYTVTQIAKEFGMGAETLNRKLREMGVQYKQNGQWLLKAKYQDKGYTSTITREYKGATGKVHTSQLTVWTEPGRHFIHSLFD
jgi:phage antirepressor YoqD-like protein